MPGGWGVGGGGGGGGGRGKKRPGRACQHCDERIFERRVIANEFNKYFNSIASKLNDEIDQDKLSDLAFSSFEDYLFPSHPQSIYLHDCDAEEILDIIKQLENNKSSDIPIKVIKKSAHVFCYTLSQKKQTCEPIYLSNRENLACLL